MIQTLARSTWLRVLLTAAILGYLATRLDMGEALRALLAVNPLASADRRRCSSPAIAP